MSAGQPINSPRSAPRPRGGREFAARLLCLAAGLALAGCGGLMASAAGRMAESASAGILNQDDPQTVRDGAPAYLLMVDGLVDGDPENRDLLLSGARLYGAYASAFVADPDRARRLAAKARDYGRRALCVQRRELCEAAAGHLDGFAAALAGAGRSDVPALYGFASAWAGWIQANADDWNAVADLPKIEAAMARVAALDEAHEQGGAHLYLGVLDTLRPASLGGKPEEGRRHFERAAALSGGRNLTAKVLLAKHYARLVFDRELHDRVLAEVLEADPREPGLTLANTLAREEARKLLESADDYF